MNNKKIIYSVLGVGGVLILIGGLAFLLTQQKKLQNEFQAYPAVSPLPTPTLQTSPSAPPSDLTGAIEKDLEAIELDAGLEAELQGIDREMQSL
ncbi:MAG: hypothetical protein A3E07_02045 [Candidatus Wildermuthbacteria bacterium RIFCSPHIGHO2_12_FULL_45_9]|uniref:Uncharacterized protein n=1 Tax=Candidatus Wildermuthbacteria bacterium RIFCSPHIGHO2_02_FULL_45_25 TaxID=1802450 RepID=A0A1G2R5K2_9BACT|nr:MAG: hypothetical protein A2748_00535 [Candidatus Wildermuthbacteria bacterium RIFCSPHIGHO2_01_FULL_45_20]OHA67669.1 MAG: hypothetical protein A3C04_01995 [Candidatus Wildermuthbacteria bacterium RIFCSPHIGHO2_02_FULL_45_25]OHA70986.1 MAG: hypothetical protein A3E07_02045 [Candidatus Wildermuthbacteria bacterium RIFCSPHIGHO2_12_FULL_45_9]